MKSSIITVVVMLLVGAGLFLFTTLNKPTNQLAQQVLKKVMNIEVVSSERREQEKLEREGLLKELEKSHKAELAYEEKLSVLSDFAKKAEGEVEKLVITLEGLQGELEEAKNLFGDMTTTEHLVYFDKNASGKVASWAYEHEGREFGGVQMERIKSANEIFLENKINRKEIMVLKDIVRAQDNLITQLMSSNQQKRLLVTELRDQVSIEKKLRENCEKYRDDAEKRGKMYGIGGVLFGLASLALAIAL